MMGVHHNRGGKMRKGSQMLLHMIKNCSGVLYIQPISSLGLLPDEGVGMGQEKGKEREG